MSKRYDLPEIELCCQTTCNSELAKLQIEWAAVCVINEKGHLLGFETQEFKAWLIRYHKELVTKLEKAKLK